MPGQAAGHHGCRERWGSTSRYGYGALPQSTGGPSADERSPLLSVLGTVAGTPRAWLAAGQALERTLLRACAHGLTSSFLNQPIEVDGLRPRLADGSDGAASVRSS
jgi:hypothetical protein